MKPQIESDEWRDVAGSNGYQVSRLGNARTVDRVVVAKNGISRRLKGVMLRPKSCGNGYVGITVHGVTRALHVLVAEAFIGPKGDGRVEVNHKDCDKSNNRVSNLEYTTSAGNKQHAKANGMFAIGERQGSSVLVGHQVLEIFNDTTSSLPQIATKYGISKSHACKLRQGKCWKHLIKART